MKILILLIVILAVVSCGDEESNRYASHSDISIYLVKQGQQNINYSDENLNLKNIEVEAVPWVKSSEIVLYDWSSHTLYLNTKKEKEEYSGRNFILFSGDKPLFPGVFFPMYMSSFPAIPSIIPEDGLFYPENVIHFGQLGYQFTGNLNQQTEFKQALISSGILHEGIKVEVTSVKKVNTNTISYTYRVSNSDTKILYIPDPDKMSPSRFHYITNGVWFVKGNTYYFPNEISHTPFEKFENSWFYKLKPGEEITRKVELSGFITVPGGDVKCAFSFPGGQIGSDDWKKSDGRIWYGEFYTEKELAIQ